MGTFSSDVRSRPADVERLCCANYHYFCCIDVFAMRTCKLMVMVMVMVMMVTKNF